MKALTRMQANPVAALTAVALLLAACGPTGPKPPAPGTPAFNWNAAENAYKTGDFVKANDLLAGLSESDNEYTARARPWSLVMSFALIGSYMELAEKLDAGAARNRANPAVFRRQSAEYKALAKAAVLRYIEQANRFIAANQDKEVTLAFAPPEASFDDPPQYDKITIGQMIPDAELAGVEKEVIRREILRGAARALNLPEDKEKVMAAFAGGEAKAPGPRFLLSMAQNLHDVGEMLGPKGLDQPHRIELAYKVALAALELVKDDKEATALAKKIAAAQKKLKR